MTLHVLDNCRRLRREEQCGVLASLVRQLETALMQQGQTSQVRSLHRFLVTTKILFFPMLLLATSTPLMERECIGVQGRRVLGQFVAGIFHLILGVPIGLLQALMMRTTKLFLTRRNQHAFGQTTTQEISIRSMRQLVLPVTVLCLHRQLSSAGV